MTRTSIPIASRLNTNWRRTTPIASLLRTNWRMTTQTRFNGKEMVFAHCNLTKELWSMLEFMMPDLFTTKDVDLKKLLIGEDRDLIGRMKSILGPFILRRLKSDLITCCQSVTNVHSAFSAATALVVSAPLIGEPTPFTKATLTIATQLSAQDEKMSMILRALHMSGLQIPMPTPDLALSFTLQPHCLADTE
ncbi:helicase swr1-like [Pyrus ussuriensis x Pyrus communis]|uniref:Helicase swr1-like n=1 Tax=Pyrus ussuriensis x Pyrus communis TaxID=2448454 RepID=A0A5N5FT15_9ROSA|nr:helicase swr1-like [Pyrus ussuriensis x Pyrus communis]